MALNTVARSLLHDTQLGDLRTRASALMSEQVIPAASQAATAAAAPFRGALDYLPLLLEYAGPVLQLFRRTQDRVQDAGAQAIDTVRDQRGLFTNVARTARPYVIGAAVLGASYVVFRLVRVAQREHTKRPGRHGATR